MDLVLGAVEMGGRHRDADADALFGDGFRSPPTSSSSPVRAKGTGGIYLVSHPLALTGLGELTAPAE